MILQEKKRFFVMIEYYKVEIFVKTAVSPPCGDRDE